MLAIFVRPLALRSLLLTTGRIVRLRCSRRERAGLRVTDGTGYFYAHLRDTQSGQRTVRAGEQTPQSARPQRSAGWHPSRTTSSGATAESWSARHGPPRPHGHLAAGLSAPIGGGIASRASQVALAAFGFSALVGLTYGALYAWNRWRTVPRPAPDARGAPSGSPIRRSGPLWRWLKAGAIRTHTTLRAATACGKRTWSTTSWYACEPVGAFRPGHQREGGLRNLEQGHEFPAVDHVQVSVQHHAVRRHALLHAVVPAADQPIVLSCSPLSDLALAAAAALLPRGPRLPRLARVQAARATCCLSRSATACFWSPGGSAVGCGRGGCFMPR